MTSTGARHHGGLFAGSAIWFDLGKGDGLVGKILDGEDITFETGINRPESPDLPWDGAWIAFDGLGVAGERDIYIMPMFGGEATQLTSDLGADYQPAWRPVYD